MITKLEWDTNFFGYSIARFEPNQGINESEFADQIEICKRQGIQLIYCFCNDESQERIADQFGQLVDKKVTFYKRFNLDSPFLQSEMVEEYMSDEPTEKLYDLAIQSGVYSRFNVDSKLPREKFEELYRIWIKNSTNKTKAFKVYVAKQGEQIVGMITLGQKGDRADIGLLAVDSNYRGKGIGRALMNAAEKEFIAKDFKDGQVVTQKNNTPACGLYESCGYTAEKIESIYHIWLN